MINEVDYFKPFYIRNPNNLFDANTVIKHNPTIVEYSFVKLTTDLCLVIQYKNEKHKEDYTLLGIYSYQEKDTIKTLLKQNRRITINKDISEEDFSLLIKDNLLFKACRTTIAIKTNTGMYLFTNYIYKEKISDWYRVVVLPNKGKEEPSGKCQLTECPFEYVSITTQGKEWEFTEPHLKIIK